MKMKLTFASLALAGLTFSHAQDVAKDDRPVVQIAILLDNSGSMQGLIQQAKTQIWQIVNEFVSAKQDGKVPRVQVGLYEYGIKDAQDDGSYVRQLAPLTEDLDSLSEKLSKSTSGIPAGRSSADGSSRRQSSTLNGTTRRRLTKPSSSREMRNSLRAR